MKKIKFALSKPVKRKTKKSGDYQEEQFADVKDFDVFFDGRNKSSERLFMVKSEDGRVYEVLTRVGPTPRPLNLQDPIKKLRSHYYQGQDFKIENFKSNKKSGDYFDDYFDYQESKEFIQDFFGSQDEPDSKEDNYNEDYFDYQVSK